MFWNTLLFSSCNQCSKDNICLFQPPSSHGCSNICVLQAYDELVGDKCYKLARYQWTGLGNSILPHFFYGTTFVVEHTRILLPSVPSEFTFWQPTQPHSDACRTPDVYTPCKGKKVGGLLISSCNFLRKKKGMFDVCN
jgi:hypothetical protein